MRQQTFEKIVLYLRIINTNLSNIKIMKTFLISILILCCGAIATAQDTLILLDETIIGVKILKDTENEYFYYLSSDQNKNQRVINKKFVKEVKLQNDNSLAMHQETKDATKTDVIIYRNGDKSMVDVVDVGKENLIYRESGKEINYVIPLDQVARIEYADGQVMDYEKDQFNKKSVIIKSNEPESVSDPVSDPVSESEAISGDIDKNRLAGFVFGGKVGYFLPFNDGLREVYGSGFSYGLELGYWGRNGFGWNLEFREFAKRGQVTSEFDFSGTTFNLMSLTTSFNYAFVEKGQFKTYAGIGLGAAFFSLSDASESINETLFEYYPYGGIYFKPLYVEARFVNTSWEGENVGGFEFCFGIIF